MNNQRLNKFQYNGFSADIISALQRRGKLRREEWWKSGTVVAEKINDYTFVAIIPFGGKKMIAHSHFTMPYAMLSEVESIQCFVVDDEGNFSTNSDFLDLSNLKFVKELNGAFGSSLIVRITIKMEEPEEEISTIDIKFNLYGYSFTDDGMDWNEPTDLTAPDFDQDDFNPNDFN